MALDICNPKVAQWLWANVLEHIIPQENAFVIEREPSIKFSGRPSFFSPKTFLFPSEIPLIKNVAL